MIRRLGASLLAFGALAAPAGAATFAELPVTVLEAYAGCLHATGTPGELALSGIGAEGVQMLRAGRTAVTRTETLAVPSCSTVAGRPNGAGVAAGDADSTVVAAVRDPGGAWSVPLDLDYPTSKWNVTATTAAVSDRGDAVVAWVEHTFEEPERMRVRVARRAPGAGFGKAQTLVTGANEIQDVQAGVAANGDAFVLWTTMEGAFAPHRNVVRVASAPAGRPFGPATIVGTMPWRSAAALAVAQDGRALVAFRLQQSLVVAERPPGGTFGPAGIVGTAEDAVGVVAQAVIEDGGRAAIAWRGIDSAGARLVSRPVAGPFSPSVQLVEDLAPERDADPFYATESFAKVSGYIGSPPAAGLTLTPDGQVVYAAAADVPRHDEDPESANLFTLALGGAHAQRETLRPRFDYPEGVRAFLLADGTPATAYIGPAGTQFNLHVAATGAVPAADGPLPTVRLRGPSDPVVRDNSMFVRVRCSGPCDVAVEIVGQPGVKASTRRSDGGTSLLGLFAATPFAPKRLGPVRVRLTYGAPNAQHPRSRTVALRLRRAPAPAIPRVTNVTAARQGNHVVVRWRTSRAMTGYLVAVVSGAPERTEHGESLQAVRVSTNRSTRSFTKTLTQQTKAMRWVTVRNFYDDPITVKVR